MLPPVRVRSEKSLLARVDSLPNCKNQIRVTPEEVCEASHSATQTDRISQQGERVKDVVCVPVNKHQQQQQQQCSKHSLPLCVYVTCLLVAAPHVNATVGTGTAAADAAEVQEKRRAASRCGGKSASTVQCSGTRVEGWEDGWGEGV